MEIRRTQPGGPGHAYNPHQEPVTNKTLKLPVEELVGKDLKNHITSLPDSAESEKTATVSQQIFKSAA